MEERESKKIELLVDSDGTFSLQAPVEKEVNSRR